MASAILLSALTFLGALHSTAASGSYESFRRTHGGAHFGEGSVSYQERVDLFKRRRAEALAHNAHNLSWTMAVNHFSDHTDEELQSMLGYKRGMGKWHSSAGSSFIEINDHENIVNVSQLASEVDYRKSLKSSSWVRNQGSCGSCWAVAAVGALEMHAEKQLGHATQLSHQQLVDCVVNTRHCGGKGGCDGATAELAYELVRKNGISSDAAYKSSAGGCNKNAPSSLRVAHFSRLPINTNSHLLHAIATHGPVVVSADGGKWFGYKGGVYSGCQKDTVVNHAVLNVGYGHDDDSDKNYWLIRNSWGEKWGEKGYLKVERHTSDGEYCGTDNKPKDGVFCDDAPPTVPVCGMCGIESDSVVPSVAHMSEITHHNRLRTNLANNLDDSTDSMSSVGVM